MLTEASTALMLTSCLHPLIEEVYHTRTIPTGNGVSVPMNVYIPREQGDYLYSVVRHLRPDLTVEVGMANGLSTLFIAAALHENGCGEHIAIDPFQASQWKNAGKALLHKAGLDSIVQLRQSFSHQALAQLEKEGARAQFIFVDGSHLFDYVMADFLCCDRILDVDGLIAFDDSDWPAVTQVLRYVLANRNYEVAFPEVVIERPRISPTLSANVVRKLGNAFPKLGSKFRPDFLVPNEDAGVMGRCVVLRKLGDDDRDSQDRNLHFPF